MNFQLKHVAAAAKAMGLDVSADASALSDSCYLEVGDFKIRFSDHSMRPTYGAMRGWADYEVGTHQDANTDQWLNAIFWLSRETKQEVPASVVRTWIRERVRAVWKIELTKDIERDAIENRKLKILRDTVSALESASDRQAVRDFIIASQAVRVRASKVWRKRRAMLRAKLESVLPTHVVFSVEIHPLMFAAFAPEIMTDRTGSS